MPPRSLEPTDRAECFLTLGSAPFGVHGTDAEQTLHSRCVDVEASGRRYTVIKNSVIACGLFPPRSLLLLFLLPPEAPSLLLLLPSFFFHSGKKNKETSALSFCICHSCCFLPSSPSRACRLPLLNAPPPQIASFSPPVYIHSCLLLTPPTSPVGSGTSCLCLPPSFYQFHFRILKKILSVTHSCKVKWQAFETKGSSFSFAISS